MATRINAISDEVITELENQSVLTLPNNPSAAGYSAAEIKRRLYQSISGGQQSIVQQVNRIVAETNTALDSVISECKEYSNNKIGNKIICSENQDISSKNPLVDDIVIIKEEQ